MNLMQTQENKEYLICKIEIQDELKHKRFCELGFCSGMKIAVLRKTKNLLLVGALGCCFSIDRVLSEKIVVYGD